MREARAGGFVWGGIIPSCDSCSILSFLPCHVIVISIGSTTHSVESWYLNGSPSPSLSTTNALQLCAPTFLKSSTPSIHPALGLWILLLLSGLCNVFWHFITFHSHHMSCPPKSCSLYCNTNLWLFIKRLFSSLFYFFPQIGQPQLVQKCFLVPFFQRYLIFPFLSQDPILEFVSLSLLAGKSCVPLPISQRAVSLCSYAAGLCNAS